MLPLVIADIRDTEVIIPRAESARWMERIAQNEFAAAWRDGEVVDTTPDIICVMDSISGEAIGTEMIRYGQRVSVIVLPTPNLFLTHKGLAATGPRVLRRLAITTHPRIPASRAARPACPARPPGAASAGATPPPPRRLTGPRPTPILRAGRRPPIVRGGTPRRARIRGARDESAMASPLLETKLYRPRPRRALVARPRLRERLERGAAGALTLVAAPPGFGKTTLLAEWLAATPPGARPAAWLSLDPGDNRPATFLAYLIAALRAAVPGIGAGALALLAAPQPPPNDAVLAALLNELGARACDLVLVLDDYHAIDAREVHEAVAFLLDHRPETLHLVIASRADPPLPLARLRARGELVEIRAADLRFTPAEATAFLNEAMGLALAPGDVAALEARTEGWTTWWRRCWGVSPNPGAPSCCRPPSSIG